jgi:molybdopterin converting factor small subunit
MKLRVQYMAQLRTAIGCAEEEIELPEGSSLAALLDHLANLRGHEAAKHLLTPAGDALHSLLVIVNDSAKPAPLASTTLLQSGDTISLLPPIAGG